MIKRQPAVDPEVALLHPAHHPQALPDGAGVQEAHDRDLRFHCFLLLSSSFFKAGVSCRMICEMTFLVE